MDIITIINLIDRSLDLVGRLIERSENEKDLKEYAEVRREVRKAKVELARSLGSQDQPDESTLPPLDVTNFEPPSSHTTPAPNEAIAESEDFR